MKKLRFQFGWFKGEPFILFRLTLLEISDEGSTNIFDIQIAKLLITLYVTN